MPFPTTSLPHGNPICVKHAPDRAKRVANLVHHLVNRQPTLIEPYCSFGILTSHRLLAE
jgi:hypothetical protein